MDISNVLSENYGCKSAKPPIHYTFESLHLPADLSAKAKYNSSAPDVHTFASYQPNPKTESKVRRESSDQDATPFLMHRRPTQPLGIGTGDNKINVVGPPKTRPPTASTEELNMPLKIMDDSNDTRASRTYSLRIRQQPVAARACGFGERNRRVVDPPPVLEMQVEDPQASPQELASYRCSPYFVVYCTLWDPINDCDDSAMFGTVDQRQQRRLLGTLVASPFVGKDEFGGTGCFFLFPDLSVRTPGTYRLMFQLVVLDPVMVSGIRAPVRSTIQSDIFRVLNAKHFRGSRASTALIRSLRQQGCRGFPVKETRELEGGGSQYGEYEDNMSQKGGLAEACPCRSSTPLEAVPFIPNGQQLNHGQPFQNVHSRQVEDKNALKKAEPPSTMTSADALCILRDSLAKFGEGQGKSRKSAMDPAKRRMISGIMNDFWAIFDEQWAARILQHSGSPSEPSSDVLPQTSSEERREGEQKRSREDGEASGDEYADDGDGDSRRGGTNSNPLVNPSQSTGFGCPYRKHNPRKYNHEDREWRSCALSPLSDVSRVKGHLYRHHRIYQCERCGEVLPKESSLKSHFLAAKPCDLKTFSVVDGVTCSIEKKLKSRKKRVPNQSQADRWKEMYKLLFPDVSLEAVPSPYFEPIRDESSIGTADLFDLTTFETFSRTELPAIFEAALDAAFSANPEALEDQLRAQLIAMVRQSQDQVINEYRSRNQAQNQAQVVIAQRGADEPAAPPTPLARLRQSEEVVDPTPIVSSVELRCPPRFYKEIKRRRRQKLRVRHEAPINFADSPALETRQHSRGESVAASDQGNWSNVDIPGVDSFFNFNSQSDYQPPPDFQYQATCPTFENTSSPGTIGLNPFAEIFHFPGQIQSQSGSSEDQEARALDFQAPFP